MLQQYLPFTVLKQNLFKRIEEISRIVATVLTVYGIETYVYNDKPVIDAIASCNSTYRLRY